MAYGRKLRCEGRWQNRETFSCDLPWCDSKFMKKCRNRVRRAQDRALAEEAEPDVHPAEIRALDADLDLLD